MTKKRSNRTLSLLLALALLVGVAVPTNLMVSARELVDYKITDFTNLEKDGWISTYYNGNEITKLGGEFYMGYGVEDGKRAHWEFRSSDKAENDSVRLEGSEACEDYFNKGFVSALTYNADMMNFEFTVETELHKWHSQSMISIGVQNPGEWNQLSANAITLTTTLGGNGAYDGKIVLSGKALQNGEKSFDSAGTGWKKLVFKVFNNELELFINGESVGSMKLNENWQGGKVSIMSNNAYARYRNISIKELPALAEVVCHNYNGADRVLSIYTSSDTFGMLPVPTRDGYDFMGYYKDAALTQKALDSEVVYGFTEIWARWDKTAVAKDNYNQEITYVTNEVNTDGKISYDTYRKIVGDGDFKFAENASVAKNAGPDGTDALRFWQIRGSSVSDSRVSYVRIYDTTDTEYNLFVPEEHSKYKVTLKYKNASAAGVKFLLREVGAYGNISYNDKTVLEFAKPEAASGEWGTLSGEFVTGDAVTALYLAAVSENGEPENEAEVYIDDLIISPPESVADYSISLADIAEMEKDGWKSAYSENPQAGKPFTDCATISEYFKNNYSAVVRNEKGFDYQYNHSYGNWRDPFQRMAALTYTAKQYKYFTLSVDYRVYKPGIPWPVVTFGQPGTTPEMFYYKIGDVQNPKGGDSAIGVYPEIEGSLTIAGKNVEVKTERSTAFSDNAEWHTLTVTVTPGKVSVSVDGSAVTAETALADNYSGGYISLMLGHSYSHFKNFNISEISYSEKENYENSLSDISQMENDSWKSAYSENPQAGTPFTDCATISEYFKNNYSAVVRNEKGFDYQSNHSYGNWRDPFQRMAALTYTAKQYKYFTLSVDYRVYKPGIPWPVVTFGQPSTTPEMFYYKIGDVQDPKGGDSAIGVYPEIEGSLTIAGKNVETNTVRTDCFSDINEWHTLTVTVTPGMVSVSVDGTAVTNQTSLYQGYNGGYISLMLGHSYSHFKNLSITEYDYIDACQQEGVTEKTFEITSAQSKKPIIIKTGEKRWYELTALSAVTATGKMLKLKKLSDGVYLMEKPEPATLSVKYGKRELDYDPEHTVKYYFDWDEELDDFTASRSLQPSTYPMQNVNVRDIWSILDGTLAKTDIDVSGLQNADIWADYNVLMLKTQKFRNFELSVEYRHGKTSGLGCGVVFGLENENTFCNNADGGIFSTVEADGRAFMRGYSIKNTNDDGRWPDSYNHMIMTYNQNVPGYSKWDDKTVHTMKIRVVEGTAELYIDGYKTITAIIPNDYYGYIGLAVANNKAYYNNLTVSPLDCMGKPITLAENADQAVFDGSDFETDSWNGDNSEWSGSLIDYLED